MICTSNHPTSIQRFKTLESDFHRIHKSKYVYDKAIFTKMLDKIIVTCPEHGDFSITPAHHMNGKGCKACGSARAAFKRRHTQEQFLAAAEKISPHYDYTKAQYVDTKTKVQVICPTHGLFYITPNKLLAGRGCAQCKSQKIVDKLTKPYEQFLHEVTTLHNNKYTYFGTTYINAKTPMTVVCPEHGPFQITPDSHLNKKAGCSKCAYTKLGSSKALTTQIFSDRSNKIHNNFYDYNKVSYVNNCTPVIITCPIHGDFLQTPQNHLAGKGCRICSATWQYIDRPTSLYYVKITDQAQTYYKVGITTKSLDRRFYEEIKAGYSIELLYEYKFLDGKSAYEYEQRFLHKYDKYRLLPSNNILYKGRGDSELFMTNVLAT